MANDKHALIEQIEELIADNVELCAENAQLKEKLAAYDGVQVQDLMEKDIEWGSDEHLRNMTVDVLFAEVRYWHKLAEDEVERRQALILDMQDLLDNIVGFLDYEYDCKRCPLRKECESSRSTVQGCIGKEIIKAMATRMKGL